MTSRTYEGYMIVDQPNFPAQKRITSVGSGSVPKELRGLYTSVQVAMDAIDHLKNRKAKGKKNASKANTTAGDESVRKGADNGGESS